MCVCEFILGFAAVIALGVSAFSPFVYTTILGLHPAHFSAVAHDSVILSSLRNIVSESDVWSCNGFGQSYHVCNLDQACSERPSAPPAAAVVIVAALLAAVSLGIRKRPLPLQFPSARHITAVSTGVSCPSFRRDASMFMISRLGCWSCDVRD